MLIAIIFGLVTFVMGIRNLYDDVEGFFTFLLSLFTHLFLTVVLFFIGAFVSAGIGVMMPTHWEERQVYLVTLKEGCGIDGTFILGSGQIESSQNYYYYYKSSNNGLKPGQVTSDENVTIFETSQQNNSKLKILERKLNAKSLEHWLIFGSLVKKFKYEFYIPSGSIKKDFKP